MSVLVFDLDGTLCETPSMDYDRASPHTVIIDHVNRLYDAGHRIVIDTSRGWGANRDLRDLTRVQLAEWGVKHHALRVGHKISADRYVDAKALRPEELARL